MQASATNSPALNARPAQGFTLVELIIGMIVLSISFSVITGFLLPQTTQSANQVHQIRAAELGQTLMNEILGKAFDEHSDRAGGFRRCGDSLPAPATPMPACTTVANLGPELGETHANYNDVDDYHCNPAVSVCPQDVKDLLGTSYATDLYQGYNVLINVAYDNDYDVSTVDNNTAMAKRITITITTPSGEPIVFSTYKVNF